ncbi:3-methyladenine DNA glycosylase AlkC [Dysgonomonas alginatilytica]|uniref:3-methyladenine DNA glycosylase AlkC n=1 Tax=Dysgonomonas alginatilytica TaxID=1605892 RepID=A0A2V3PXA3_9BACT|nr:DNA alkylation repair protein [Dysgonomonas alginatilytica]PXV69228.1 3-methyladenine DNA glycosylase AlkC [Dysgonomonas alginatilytica]
MEQKRKGARSLNDLSQEILDQLNNGTIESANLTEWLAVDQTLLLQHLLQNNNRIHYLEPILLEIAKLKKQTTNTQNETIGIGLLNETSKKKDSQFLMDISSHTSDSVRCWITYTIGRNPELSLSEKLQRIQAFAADSHFGVREISWMTVRPSIIENLTESLQILAKWTSSEHENIRRFASEATRPRGVWCEHIEILKQNPELALSILEPLKSDSSKYVCDSVGNWLNDASKTQPQFVIDLCRKWENESTTKSTAYIVKKAMRTLNK